VKLVKVKVPVFTEIDIREISDEALEDLRGGFVITPNQKYR
jgi:hypothetical protein